MKATPFTVNVSSNYGLYILLSTKKPGCIRRYAYLMTIEEGAFLADRLEKVVRACTHDKDGTAFKYADQGAYSFHIFADKNENIHITIKDRIYLNQYTFQYASEECRNLVKIIRALTEQIKKAHVGVCIHCDTDVYRDTNWYQVSEDKFVHQACMGTFIQSEASADVQFPVKRIRRESCFGDGGRLYERHEEEHLSLPYHRRR